MATTEGAAGAAGLSPDGTEVVLAGPPYLDALGIAHRRLRPRTYLEIGARRGASLRMADCASLAVDPDFQLEEGVVRSKPACLLYQCTSDEFFATHDPVVLLGDRVDLAFIDGMHLFEFALRDFMHTERTANPGSVIILDDCCPRDFRMAGRTRIPGVVPPAEHEDFWTGDVWKVVPILREYRPDIDLRVIDTVPTGLAICTNLNPKDKTLTTHYEEIVERWGSVRLEEYGFARLLGDLRVEPTDDWMSKLTPLHAGDLDLPDPGPREPTKAEALAARAEALAAQLEALQRSRSWRLTSPLRWMRSHAKRKPHG